MRRITGSAADLGGLVLLISFIVQPQTAADPVADLVVNSDLLQNQWVLREEVLAETSCDVVEGAIRPGVRTLLRFSVQTPNIGDADVIVGDPNAHANRNDGLFEFATCHAHFHFHHYTTFELISSETGDIWRASKRGFCMVDASLAPMSARSDPPPRRKFTRCGLPGRPGNQGVSAGWADEYDFLLDGQYFVLDGGDGQAPVPPGRYTIRVTVNPPFVAGFGERCSFRDPNGQCHALRESNYANNIGEAFVTVIDHPGREGLGPLARTPHPTDPAAFRRYVLRGSLAEPLDGD